MTAQPLSTVAYALVALVIGGTASANQDAIEDVKNLIVMIDGSVSGARTEGAGIIVHADERRLLVVTADHVVRGSSRSASDIAVRVSWKPEEPLRAQLLPERLERDPGSSDGLSDLAVLSVTLTSYARRHPDTLPFELAVSPDGLERGDPVNFIGNPGRAWRVNVSPGRFAEKNADMLYFEADRLLPGNSGGALLDEDWRIVGMIIDEGPLEGRALHIGRVLERLQAWGLPERLGELPLPRSFKSISAGKFLVCGISDMSFAYCWNGKDTSAPRDGTGRPVQMSRLSTKLRFRSVSVGGHHLCGIAESGRTYCLGSNEWAQLGTPDVDGYSGFLVEVAGDREFRALDAGYKHTCAISIADELFCWGHMGGIYTVEEPLNLGRGRKFVAVASGDGYGCALTPDGRAFCVGRNDELGLRVRDLGELLPARADVRFRSLSAGINHACGLTLEGAVACWGAAYYGALGPFGPEADGPRWNGPRFTSVGAAGESACALAEDGRILCWGNDMWGALGSGWSPKLENGVYVDQPVRAPAPIDTDKRFRSLAAGKGYFGCGIANDDGVHCWGRMRRRLDRRDFGDFGPVPKRLAVTKGALR